MGGPKACAPPESRRHSSGAAPGPPTRRRQYRRGEGIIDDDDHGEENRIAFAFDSLPRTADRGGDNANLVGFAQLSDCQPSRLSVAAFTADDDPRRRAVGGEAALRWQACVIVGE
jgi:hypothetical protein